MKALTHTFYSNIRKNDDKVSTDNDRRRNKTLGGGPEEATVAKDRS